MFATNAEKLLVSLTLSWNSAIQSRGGVQEVTKMTKISKRLDYYKKNSVLVVFHAIKYRCSLLSLYVLASSSIGFE